MPEIPRTRPIALRPDWALEIISPSNSRRDLVVKPRLLAAAGVPHYWIIYPSDRILVVHRLVGGSYEIVHTASESDTIRVEPFQDVELRVATLFGEPDDE
ncbi:hypothetical protein BH11MYX2_BH11MYX2_03260 [soil metagenome]